MIFALNIISTPSPSTLTRMMNVCFKSILFKKWSSSHFLAVTESLLNNIIYLTPDSNRLDSLPLTENVYDFCISVYGMHNWPVLEQFLRENGIDSSGYSFSSTYGSAQFEARNCPSLEFSEQPYLVFSPYTFHGTLPSIISFIRTFKPVPIDIISADGKNCELRQQLLFLIFFPLNCM